MHVVDFGISKVEILPNVALIIATRFEVFDGISKGKMNLWELQQTPYEHIVMSAKSSVHSRVNSLRQKPILLTFSNKFYLFSSMFNTDYVVICPCLYTV